MLSTNSVFVKHTKLIVVEYVIDSVEYNHVVLKRIRETNLSETRAPKQLVAFTKDIKTDREGRRYILYIKALDAELKLSGQDGIFKQLIKHLFRGK
jgi:hypothetical protein